MNLTITNQTCNDIVYNGHYLEKLYFGNDLVWEKQHANPYASEYFTIESLENSNTITFTKRENAPSKTFYYSRDKSSWYSFSSTKNITLNKNAKLYIRSDYSAISNRSGDSSWYISASKTFNVSGNIMSLYCDYNSVTHDYDDFINKDTLSNSQSFFNLFYEASTLISAANLVLPATTISEECYMQMFYNCTSLTAAPKLLPATTLAEACYEGMFGHCSSLVSVPTILATTLAYACCMTMFFECTSLVTGPELLATTLAAQCYQSMFSGCTLLSRVTCLATNTSASGCTYSWMHNVAQSGTFVKNSSKTWARSENGIPTGWTVVNAS